MRTRPVPLAARVVAAVSLASLLGAAPVAAEEEPEELAYSRPGGYVGLGGGYAVENFSGHGPYDDSGSILFRAGYRGLPNVAVDFLGEVLTEFESDRYRDVDGYAVTVNLRLLLPLGRFEPYGSVGFGVLSINPDDAHREDDFAFRSAVGLDLYLTPRWALFGEAAYMLPTGDVKDFDYATYGAGFLFRF
jgi:opacity protein-like surface antigen